VKDYMLSKLLLTSPIVESSVVWRCRWQQCSWRPVLHRWKLFHDRQFPASLVTYVNCCV